MRVSRISLVILGLVLGCWMWSAGAEEFSTSFARGKWDPSQWIVVKSPRFNYIGVMVQRDDHIENKTPEVSPEEVFKKYCAKVYSSIMLDRKIKIGKTVSSTMSFDYSMAPLIVIAEEIGKSAKGEPEFREHYEVVLYNEGINIWHHTYKDGKPGWYRAAFLKAKFEANKKYRLEVQVTQTRKGKVMTVTCDGHSFGFMDNNLPDSFYAGIIGCEGRNSFYDFVIK